MDHPIYYPPTDFGPLMKGLAIGGVAIVHVFLAQFTVGGGLLMCYFQWLAQTGRSLEARNFVAGYFKFLVLVSFVAGALTGVGIWFMSIQVSPSTIGMMIHEFHWLWGVEWTFFCLEIVAGYAYYRYQDRLDDREKMTLLVMYAGASWFSLFWINGIISWQLTPGAWITTRQVWDGFFNPTFWPSLLFRSVVAMTLAALAACVVINTMPFEREARQNLINRAAQFLLPMVLMPVLGLWYFLAIPADSRSWLLGGSAAMSLFLATTVGVSVLLGGYALIGMWRQKLYINGATATLLVTLAFVATAGGEFLREGSRKPYTVRGVMFSNSVLPEQIAGLRISGSVSADPYPLRNADQYPNDQVRLGAKVLRFQCAICHTLDGANGLTHLTGTWDLDQIRMNVAKLQHTKPFMPPFSGTPEELEALTQYLAWFNSGQPGQWPVSKGDDLYAQLARWIEEAGVEPGGHPKSQRKSGSGAR